MSKLDLSKFSRITDLKTQNIFLTSNNIVKVGDFGIARILTKHWRSRAHCDRNSVLFESRDLSATTVCFSGFLKHKRKMSCWHLCAIPMLYRASLKLKFRFKRFISCLQAKHFNNDIWVSCGWNTGTNRGTNSRLLSLNSFYLSFQIDDVNIFRSKYFRYNQKSDMWAAGCILYPVLPKTSIRGSKLKYTHHQDITRHLLTHTQV